MGGLIAAIHNLLFDLLWGGACNSVVILVRFSSKNSSTAGANWPSGQRSPLQRSAVG
jgi:hypothetical protein